jgi:hypothetical protein
MKLTDIIAKIEAQITANGNNEVTGTILQEILLDIINYSAEIGSNINPYDNAASYIKPDVVSYNNNIYQCSSTIAITGILPTDQTKWTLISTGTLVHSHPNAPVLASLVSTSKIYVSSTQPPESGTYIGNLWFNTSNGSWYQLASYEPDTWNKLANASSFYIQPTAPVNPAYFSVWYKTDVNIIYWFDEADSWQELYTITISALAGTGNRMMQVNAAGTMSASREIFSAKLTDAVTQALLVNHANWTNKLYTGTAITNTKEGMEYMDADYSFRCYVDNYWIRTARV